jgi:hypothetical protein
MSVSDGLLGCPSLQDINNSSDNKDRVKIRINDFMAPSN